MEKPPPIIVAVYPVPLTFTVPQDEWVTATLRLRLKSVNKDGAVFDLHAKDHEGKWIPCGEHGFPKIIMDVGREAEIDIPVKVESERDEYLDTTGPGPTDIIVHPEAVAIKAGVQGAEVGSNGQGG
jgi:hypothetical protein